MAKKKKNNLKRNVIVIVLCIIFGVGAYFGSLFIDKARKGGTVDMVVTFDDTESYVIPNTSKLDKEKALEEWPYIINVENKGNAKALYQIKISDIEDNTITRDDLAFSLVLDDKEVKEGKLKDIENDILYTGEVDGNIKQNYKLYIWVDKDIEEKEDSKNKYEYKLEFNTIKAGGPGF